MAKPKGSFLVLWQTAEAEFWVGTTPGDSVGSHMKGVSEGDRIFIAACDGQEIYLLGALKISTVSVQRGGPYDGKPRADGKSLAGAFQMIPLGKLKWQLRFESAESPKLSKSKSLLWQVRSRRALEPASATQLLEVLKSERTRQGIVQTQFRNEGKGYVTQGTKRERDPNVRKAALRKYGYTCMVCGLNPFDRYGLFAKSCLEVHHLKPLALSGKRGQPTTVQDVIVTCPTCHRALHLSGDPSAWRQLKRQASLG